jgi:hypothetical protein
MSGPGTDELVVPNRLSPDDDPHFLSRADFKGTLYISRIDPSMKTTGFRICGYQGYILPPASAGSLNGGFDDRGCNSLEPNDH